MTPSRRARQPDPQAVLNLRLYIAGGSPNSSIALANLRSALALFPGHRVELEVIDVLDDPERGLRDKVLLTPMLLCLEPLPERRILGTLGDRAILLSALGVLEAPDA